MHGVGVEVRGARDQGQGMPGAGVKIRGARGGGEGGQGCPEWGQRSGVRWAGVKGVRGIWAVGWLGLSVEGFKYHICGGL